MPGRLREFLRSDGKARRIWARLVFTARRLRVRLALARLVKFRRNSAMTLRSGLVITHVDPDIELAFEEIWIRRDYARPGFDVRPGDVVIDIGAHVGLFTLYAAHRARARRVISYEPSSAAFRLLQENLRRNALRNVTAHNLAVAGEPGERILFSRPDRRMGSSLFEENFTAESLRPIATESVRCVTLEEVFGSNSVTVCDFLKMDCERSEYEILRFAPDGIWARIRRIAMEYHVAGSGEDAEGLHRFLKERGFRVQSHPFPGTTTRGLLFARREIDAARP